MSSSQFPEFPAGMIAPEPLGPMPPFELIFPVVNTIVEVRHPATIREVRRARWLNEPPGEGQWIFQVYTNIGMFWLRQGLNGWEYFKHDDPPAPSTGATAAGSTADLGPRSSPFRDLGPR